MSRLCILTASYNDWPSLQALLPLLDTALAGRVDKVTVVVVDDGSPIEPAADLLAGQAYQVIDRVELVTLTRNLGNQRALGIGVGWIAAHVECDWLAVMDCDHEDRPEVVPDLLAAAQAANGQRIVFAARTQRSEGRTFQALYGVYKKLYQALTGMPISIGNFSVIPGRMVRRLAGVWEIGIHFPAGIMRSRLPYESIGAARGTRLFGKSNMNLVNLLVHGFSGLAVHAEVVAVRVMLAALGLAGAIGLALLGLLLLKLMTDIPLLGWTSQIAVLLGGILVQALLSALLLLLLVVNGRLQRPAIPLKDHEAFVLDTARLYPVAIDRLPSPGGKG